MRYSLLFTVVILIFAACKKDKYTTAPQITYESIDPNTVLLNLPFQQMPVLTINLTDAEGDVGLKGTDTARLYITNLLTGEIDSTLILPDILTSAGKNFQGDVRITLNSNVLIKGSTRPAPKTDTVYYEVYLKDFAKNKSNTIRTNDPVYLISP